MVGKHVIYFTCFLILDSKHFFPILVRVDAFRLEQKDFLLKVDTIELSELPVETDKTSIYSTAWAKNKATLQQDK